MAKKFIDADMLKEEIEQNWDMQDLYLPIHFFDKVDDMPAADVVKDESVLKFYYCESEDDYYLGLRVDNFYYAKYDKACNEFTWCMSRYLPWGEYIADEKTLWKEHTYPSEPTEIGFDDWLKGFIAKYITADVEPVIHAKWKKTISCGEINGLEIPKEHTVFRCSECGYEFEHEGYLAYFNYCPCCGAKMDGENE